MITLYGIKNCDTVKKARRWLEYNSIDYHFHDFREQGISESLVQGWLKQCPLEKLVNKRSTSWKQLDETERERLSAETAPALCCQYETLIKRPVLDMDGTITVGFSEKNYQTLFNR